MTYQGLIASFNTKELNLRSDHGARTNQLLADELLDAHVAELPTVAGILDSAEREFRVGPVQPFVIRMASQWASTLR